MKCTDRGGAVISRAFHMHFILAGQQIFNTMGTNSDNWQLPQVFDAVS